MKPAIFCTLLLCLTLCAANAQSKQSFTLDDLIPGGKTYEQRQPENRYYTWVDDQLTELASKPKNTSYDLSETSGNKAIVRHHNLYIITREQDTIAVSEDGSLDVVYGESVHRNEWGISKGTFWSPTGRYLAFYRMDQSMVSTYPQVNVLTKDDGKNSRCAVLEAEKYPMAGEQSHVVTIGIYDTETRQTHYLNTTGEYEYLTNVTWSPDEKSIYLFSVNREQDACRLMRYDISKDEHEMLFEETNEKYVEPRHPIYFLPWDTTKFVYLSRKDGWLHFYLYDTKTQKEIRQLTQGEYEVMDFVGFCPSKKLIIYTSNEVDLLQKNVFSVDMKGKRTLLDDGTGWHTPQLSPNGLEFVDNYSSPTIARKIVLRSTIGKKSKDLYTADDPWAEFNVPEMRVGTVKAADGVTDLYYRMVLPVDFDSTKVYPAIVYVYGGPHAHMVDASRNWKVRGWDIWMAQKGFVMFGIDNRGTENRGLAFEQATFRKLGVEEMKDQLCGLQFLKSQAFVDSTRIGIHGWSFGGFMTTSMLTTYPGVFKVGVAGGPVIDWKYYEIMYGERYMDTPQNNPDGYAETSLLNKAGNLQDRLLIIYGGNDPTCVPQHTLTFLKACIDAETYPDLFTYPGQGHNMRDHDRIHLHHKITQYFLDFL